MSRQEDFLRFRAQYPRFVYEGYDLTRGADAIEIAYHFSIDGLCRFTPALSIETRNLDLRNPFDSPAARRIVFSLGMVELISYWKCACPPRVRIACGGLDAEDIAWWKKLYWHGLGEFFYRNGVETDKESFMTIEAPAPNPVPAVPYHTSSEILVPVGGGKDSNVTLELLQEKHASIRPFLINPRGACIESARAAGYDESAMIRVHRTISPELLTRNRAGFLNGHTPFSAIVAFTSFYCAYLTGGAYIALSNEASANEANIAGTEINHQYSKSFAFECDFDRYTAKNLIPDIHYFSLLRPFNELQIARQFAAYPQYHMIFKSCNAGSKTDCWCRSCPKCLFVYALLSPFLPPEQLTAIFGEDLFGKEALRDIFDGLVGFSPVKPFECVGTREEIRLALAMTVRSYRAQGRAFPALLAYYADRADIDAVLAQSAGLLREYHLNNNIPPAFESNVREMYAYVSAAD